MSKEYSVIDFERSINMAVTIDRQGAEIVRLNGTIAEQAAVIAEQDVLIAELKEELDVDLDDALCDEINDSMPEQDESA